MAAEIKGRSEASSSASISIELPPDPRYLDLNELVHLIAGEHPQPPWLDEFLADYTSTIWIDRAVTAKVPTRREYKKKLEGVSHASRTLLSALTDNDLWDFVGESGLADVASRERLQRQLELLAQSAQRGMSAFIGPNGKLKAGRGHAFSSQTVPPEVIVAVVIAECWKHVRGDYPAPRTAGAQKAADILWVASGGSRREHSADPLESWRQYLKKAMTTSAPKSLEAFRSDLRQRLTAAAYIHNATENNRGDPASI